jgi:hypothetical protein
MIGNRMNKEISTADLPAVMTILMSSTLYNFVFQEDIHYKFLVLPH